ncbi:hypothetical protein GCM10020367_30740 [Streptomyces sannanensis]|uniref:FHA domain-containing protein n=1 Tax=Streptomyces sannanensis TaxID=285536 RepID=A0ABP6SC52_9ACTN
MGNDRDLPDALNPDFLALGLGGTNMMAMLWSVAMGRSAVGVEMRGDPAPGAGWNIAADTYHQLGLVDQMMLERYGEERLPRRGDGRIFRLAECFHSPGAVSGTIAVEEVIDCYIDFEDEELKVAGNLEYNEFIDDRWQNGTPHRVVSALPAAKIPEAPDPRLIRTDVAEILQDTFPFQVSAAELLTLMRRYLEELAKMDLAEGLEEPRVRLFSTHRAITAADGGGFSDAPDGRKRIRVEALQELDFRGYFVHVRRPGSKIIDIGVPELFMVAQGPESTDAEQLGYRAEPVVLDHGDGRGPVPATADFVATLFSMYAQGRFRYRISTELDEDNDEYWTRQMLIGHENDPEVGWIMVQVPEFMTFDPVAKGMVSADTDDSSPRYFAAYQQLLKEFFLDRAEELLELPKKVVKRINTFYGPKLVTITMRAGTDAQVAPNGVVAGETFGNGHFINGGNSVTGMTGHSSRVLRYWQQRDAGETPEEAIRVLADGIKEDTESWIRVSEKEFAEAPQHHFNEECFREIAAARNHRRHLVTLDLSDWNRLLVHAGRLHTAPLPPPADEHPATRGLGWTRAQAQAESVLIPESVNVG